METFYWFCDDPSNTKHNHKNVKKNKFRWELRTKFGLNIQLDEKPPQNADQNDNLLDG